MHFYLPSLYVFQVSRAVQSQAVIVKLGEENTVLTISNVLSSHNTHI